MPIITASAVSMLTRSPTFTAFFLVVSSTSVRMGTLAPARRTLPSRAGAMVTAGCCAAAIGAANAPRRKTDES
ncbi:hypothetical protein ACFSUK_21180 [Sphingobium scionense]